MPQPETKQPPSTQAPERSLAIKKTARTEGTERLEVNMKLKKSNTAMRDTATAPLFTTMPGQKGRAGVDAVLAEADGLLDIFVIDAASAWAAARDREIPGLLDMAVAITAEFVERTSAPCGCCHRPVRRVTGGTVLGVVSPYGRDNATKRVGFVICDRCSADRATLPEKVTKAVRAIFPGLQPPIGILHPDVGNA
ncbi:MAG: hypothetical protein ACJ8AI_32855 [Rhodopila sp.]